MTMLILHFGHVLKKACHLFHDSINPEKSVPKKYKKYKKC